MVFYTNSYQETRLLAIKVANAIKNGCFIAFNGDLGAGKTAFVTGLAEGLGSKEAVSSPTFALLNQYTDGRIPLYHFDLYRITAGKYIHLALTRCFLTRVLFVASSGANAWRSRICLKSA